MFRRPHPADDTIDLGLHDPVLLPEVTTLPVEIANLRADGREPSPIVVDLSPERLSIQLEARRVVDVELRLRLVRRVGLTSPDLLDLLMDIRARSRHRNRLDATLHRLGPSDKDVDVTLLVGGDARDETLPPPLEVVAQAIHVVVLRQRHHEMVIDRDYVRVALDGDIAGRGRRACHAWKSFLLGLFASREARTRLPYHPPEKDWVDCATFTLTASPIGEVSSTGS
jgi:hypothetical protein